MWQLIVQGTILAGLWAYHRWVDPQPGPKAATGVAKPAVEVGAVLPLLYGTCRVRIPVLAWSGNFTATPLEDITPEDAVGFAYSVDMFFIIGIPFTGGLVDSLVIYAGDFALYPNEPWEPPLDAEGLPMEPVLHRWENPYAYHATITGSTIGGLKNVYGGYGLGGGLGTQVELWRGDAEQVIADGADYSFTEIVMRDAGVDVALIPGHRRQACILLYHWNLGETSRMESYSFSGRSVTSEGMPAWFGQSMPYDADPAAVIYDLLTSAWGKIGLSPDRVDRPSFEAASLVLYNESHGYSAAIEQVDDASSVIGDILKQIDGLIYEEPVTGKLVLRLIRDDYDIAALLDINPDNMDPPGSNWYTVQGWDESYNQVRIKYTHREYNYADGVAVGQNMANVIGQGGRLRSIDISHPGINIPELAGRVASRELSVLSRPSVQATVTVNREFYACRPGDAVTLTWPEAQIDHMVMRVVHVDRGELHAGKISLALIRDVFDVEIGAFPVV